MPVVCEVCRQLVLAHGGYVVMHGVSFHGRLDLCSGSYLRVCSGCSV